jgi:hypothetical protein
MLDIALQEVKIYMESISKTTEELNILAYRLLTMYVVIIAGLLGFIFSSKNNILPACVIIIIFTFFGIIVIAKTLIQGDKYEVNGSQMKDFQLSKNKYDAYKTENNLKHYLIMEYQRKATFNNEQNAKKRKHIEHSLGFIYFGTGVSVPMLVIVWLWGKW